MRLNYLWGVNVRGFHSRRTLCAPNKAVALAADVIEVSQVFPAASLFNSHNELAVNISSRANGALVIQARKSTSRAKNLGHAQGRSTAARGGAPRMGVRRRLGQGMDPRVGHAVCLGQQPGVLHTLLVAVEAATGSAGPRAPAMLDVGFTRCGPATKTSDERCDGRGRAAQQFRHSAPRW
jgi:hypothetical protein